MKNRLSKFIALWMVACFAFILLAPALPLANAETETDKIITSGCNYPTSLVAGHSFTIKGKVMSETSKIIKLVVGVYNASNKMVTGRNWNPKSTSVDLRWYANSYVEFGKLAAGTYTYKITATNATRQEVLLEKSFVVTPAPVVPDGVKATGLNYPKEIEKGKGFSIKGIVYSQKSKLTKVVVGVFNASGKMVTGRSWDPKAKSVNIHWYANDHVNFSKLNVGTYTYKVIATNATETETLLSKEFTVVEPEPIPDEVKASGLNHPTEIVQGKSFAIKGTVYSQNSKITKLVVGVFNGSDKMVTGRSWNPKAKTVDLRWYANPFIKFSTLKAGDYTYKVVATNASETETLMEEPFTVTEPDPASDELKASGCNYPKILVKGHTFAIKGVVSSETSKITKLVVGVFSASGKMVTGRSWNPKAKSVDLRWYVNSYAKFGFLSVGTYTYKIVATNATGTETLLEKTFDVVK